MCEPTTILMVTSMAIAAYSAYSSHEQQEAEADAAENQQDYNQMNWLLEQEANQDAAQSQIDQINVQQVQEVEKGQEELTIAEREMKSVSARAMVASGEMGVSGNLSASLLDSLALQSSEQMAAIHGNIEGTTQQSQHEKEEAARRGKTVGTGPASVILRPNLTRSIIEGGLGIAGAGASAYSKRSKKTDTHRRDGLH
jgi:hypothetical protein